MEVNHVRGHQDEKKRKEQLTMAENLNIMADKIIGKNASNPKSKYPNGSLHSKELHPQQH